MIHLCVAKIGWNKFTITTSDMKHQLEAPYFQKQQKENFEAQNRYLHPYEQQQAHAAGTGGIGALLGGGLGAFLEQQINT